MIKCSLVILLLLFFFYKDCLKLMKLLVSNVLKYQSCDLANALLFLLSKCE